VIKEVRNQQKEAEKILSDLNKEIKQTRDKNSLAQRAEEITERKLSEKRKELEDLEKKADSILEERELIREEEIASTKQELEELQREQAQMRGINNELTEQNGRLEESAAILKGKLVGFKRELTENLIVHASLTDALAGRRGTRKKLKKLSTPIFEIYGNDDDARNHVIENFRNALLLSNREIDSFDTACLTTLVCQNFLSIFYGKPGTGKTSLANIIGSLFSNNSIGHTNMINVQRGWMRSDEILGFHNSLNNSREYDQFGFFENIQSLNSSKEGLLSHYLIAILDEANLSPIEHYWSDFIGISDTFWSTPILSRINSNELDDSATEDIRIPNGLRFLATINTDSTTEQLSDRLINRASFVHMKEPEVLGNSFSLDEIDPINISASQLNKAFYVDQFPEDLTSNSKNLSELKHKYKILNISPRKEKSLLRFLSIIEQSKYLEDRNPTEALDQGLIRLVFPGIKGEGKMVLKQLEELSNELTNKNLKETSQYVRKLIEIGETQGHYYRGLDVL